MLSRVADSLFWTSRYIERAEDLTRLLAVNFHTLLDAGKTDDETDWQPLIAMTYKEAEFREHYASFTTNNVIDFVLWNQVNPNAVIWCITMARENARSVREQISREMWEHLNRLYFEIREADQVAVARSLLDFFYKVRDGSQAFQGITNETMTHGEAYQFIQLGKHLERAEKTARILAIKYEDVRKLAEGSPDEALQLMAMLKSCSAFEPFRKDYAAHLSAEAVVEYLLLQREFPRSVAFGINRSLMAVDMIGGNSDANRQSHPHRALGRLAAELEYLDPQEILGERLRDYLDQLVLRLHAAGDAITHTFFNTQVILPELHPQQAQQQQQ